MSKQTIQENMAEKRDLLDYFDKKIKRTNELIEETRKRNLSTLVFESKVAGFLRSREYIRKEYDKLAVKLKELNNG